MEEEKKPLLRVNPLLIGGILFGVVVLIVLIIALSIIFRTNPYGEETVIDNFSSEFKDVPQDEKDLIFNQLYVIIYNNSPAETFPPSSGALVREGTAKYEYDENTKVYNGEFIVDIESVKQSYKMRFSWSPKKNNENLDGYPVIATCLPRRLQIYEVKDSCVGTIDVDLLWENAFQLDYIVGNKTSTRIRGLIDKFLVYLFDDEEKYSITIDAPSLKRDKTQADFVYTFDASLNQEYDFSVIVRTDVLYGDEYVAFYIKLGKNEKGFVLTDEESLTSELSEWLKNESKNENLAIEIDSLGVDD